MSVIRVALAQFSPVKGAPEANLDRIEEIFRSFRDSAAPPDLVIFPEASLTGYFLEGGVQEHAWRSDALFDELNRRHRRSGAPTFELCIGCYERSGERCYNSVIWMALGGEDAGVKHLHRKIFLPTYGIFDEDRFVDGGHEVRAFDARFGRVAMLVCEDLWHSLPATIAAVDGAVFLAVVAAGPGRGLAADATLPGWPATQARWEQLVRSVATEHGIFVALSQLTGFEGGKAFPGGSLLVSPTGDLLVRGPAFEAAIVEQAIDLAEVARARAQSPLLADLEVRLPWLISGLQSAGKAATPPFLSAAATPISTVRSLPISPPTLAIDAELTHRWLVAFLRAEFAARGFERAIVGLSGGLDSAVVAWLAAEALGAGNVTALRLPHRNSHPDSLTHAHLVSAALGIEERTLDITAAVDGYVEAGNTKPTPGQLGNIMARMRMIALFDSSAALNALPLGTGNKSERLLGYFTWHGDDAPPINPIGDLYKTQVYALAHHLGLPEVLLRKPPSADLIAGQTDEADFGIRYARADPLLEMILQGHAVRALLGAGFTEDEISLVRRRLDTTHWKRKLPTVAMLSGTAIGEFYLRPVDY